MATLLLILAHPDDESFMAAGTVAACVARGGRATLVCATRGERGKAGTPPLCSPDELAAFRERELRDAAGIIGIADVQVLDYVDKELTAAPADVVRAALVAAIRRERPDVVITFEPNGLTAHPDHVAISRFTADAVTAAADPRWLPEAGAAHRVGRVLWPAPLFPWDVTGLEMLAAHPGVDLVVNVDPWRDRKAAALRAHRTQWANIEPRFFTPAVPFALRIEAFRVGWGAPFSARPASDPFEGL